MTYNEQNEIETHDVKIGDVKPLETRLNVIFQVLSKENEREIQKRSGETHRVCDFTVGDDTGCITLTLWNEDIDAIQLDSTYKLSNGFANVFQNSLRLSKGKFGTISEESTSFESINEDNNRSSEHVEDPRRGRYSRGGGGYRSQSRGGRRDQDSGYDSGRRDRRSRRSSW